MNTSKRSYILVTPAKNEEENLPNLIQSISSQSIVPSCWVIVNDGSTDSTPEVIRDAEKKYSWIESLNLKEHPRDLGEHYAFVCNMGFDHAIKIAEDRGIEWSFMGLFDSDIIVEQNYIERLINEFEKNPKLGLASGHVFTLLNGEERPNVIREDLPEGGCRLWRKECFNETGYYVIAYSPDNIATTRAKIKGWDTKWFSDLKAISTRPLAGEEGHWKEYKGFGIYSHYVNLHPFFSLLKGLRYLKRKPYYIGVAFLYGYLLSVILQKEKIDDEEIRDYYWRQRPKEMVAGFLKNLGIIT